MTRTFEAYTKARPTPVMTFNAKDLAERYRERMEALGTIVTIKVARMDRRAA